MSTGSALSGINVIATVTARRAADLSQITVGATVAVVSPGLTDVQRVAEIIGVAGLPGALLKTITLNIAQGGGPPSLGEVIDVAAALALRFPGTVPLGIALTVGSMALSVYQHRERQINTGTTAWWNTARTPTRRDPLAIDLDRDGIETLGIPSTGSPVLFDHNGDGVRTGTGWLRPDDAWLVRDLDVNGSIDAGRELFGVDTVISATELIGSTPVVRTRTAFTGFEALRALDASADRTFIATVPAWTVVPLWRDRNRDGISRDTKLSTWRSYRGDGSCPNEPAATTEPIRHTITAERAPRPEIRFLDSGVARRPPGLWRSCAELRRSVGRTQGKPRSRSTESVIRTGAQA